MIREVIDKSVNGFNGINEAVENIRLSYLVKYPIQVVSSSQRFRVIGKIKKAIECTIPRTNLRLDIKTYDQYHQSEKLDDDEYNNFTAWLTYIHDKLPEDSKNPFGLFFETDRFNYSKKPFSLSCHFPDRHPLPLLPLLPLSNAPTATTDCS